MRKATALYLILMLAWTPGNDRDPKFMVITLDDLPIVLNGSTSKEMQEQIFHDILEVLDRHHVQTAGFVVGKKLTDPYHHRLLQAFADHGHTIANHTQHHPDLNKIAVEDYLQDILAGEKTIAPYVNAGKNKYFRYPMLHRGDRETKRDSVYRFLENRGYTIATVSIDNDEYTYNIPARKAFTAGDSSRLQEIGSEYLAHMEARVTYYSQLSDELLHRRMKQVLLLHMNFLNSRFLDDLLTQLEADGWTFISLEEALMDPVYALPDNYIGKRGVGWLERVEINR